MVAPPTSPCPCPGPSPASTIDQAAADIHTRSSTLASLSPDCLAESCPNELYNTSEKHLKTVANRSGEICEFIYVIFFLSNLKEKSLENNLHLNVLRAVG